MVKLLTVIAPLVKVEGNVLRKVYYPYMFFHIEVLLKGILREPRRVKGYVAIDLVRGLTFLADSMPKTYKEEAREEDIMSQRISVEEAEKLAKKKMVWVTMRRVKSIFPATVNILDRLHAYKLFLVVKEKDKVIIVDTTTGEQEEVNT